MYLLFPGFLILSVLFSESTSEIGYQNNENQINSYNGIRIKIMWWLYHPGNDIRTIHRGIIGPETIDPGQLAPETIYPHTNSPRDNWPITNSVRYKLIPLLIKRSQEHVLLPKKCRSIPNRKYPIANLNGTFNHNFQLVFL